MSKALRFEMPGASRRGLVGMARGCAVPGCGRRALPDGRQCCECQAQDEQIAAWYAQRDRREAWIRMACFRVLHAVRMRLWMPILALAVGTFSYVAFLILEDAAGWHFLEGGLQ